MVVVKMIIENCPWVTSTELINEIMVVNAKLHSHGLHLDFSMDDTERRYATMKVVSNYDNDIFIVDDELINTTTNAFENKMKNRLRIVANRVEFLAFVIESVSKMKELDEYLRVENLRFKCNRKTDDGKVIFELNRGIYVRGGGVFSYFKSNSSVEFILDIEDLDTETTSVDISDLPKELELEVNLDYVDGFATLTVSGTLTKEYERLTIDSASDLAKDFYETICYLEKL
jgi:hypothetical protein